MPSNHSTYQTLWERTFIGVVLAASSALLLTLAFPPYNLWPLIWIGFVPMLLAQYRLMPARLASLAPAVAIGGWLGAFMVPIFANIGTFMQWLPLAIGGLILLVNYALAQWVLFRFDRRWQLASGIPSPAAPSTQRWLVGVLVALAAWIGLSIALLRPAAVPTVRVAALHLDAVRAARQEQNSRLKPLRQAGREHSSSSGRRWRSITTRK